MTMVSIQGVGMSIPENHVQLGPLTESVGMLTSVQHFREVVVVYFTSGERASLPAQRICLDFYILYLAL